jgi:hypothetical protein
MHPIRLIIPILFVGIIALSGCGQVCDPGAPAGRPPGTGGNAALTVPMTENPVLTVTNEYIDPIISSSPNPELARLEVPSGMALEFCWYADASNDGGKVEAYRYGWDINDLSDPSQWAVDYTRLTKRGACAPTQTFYSGVHILHVEVIDEYGSKSQAAIKLTILPFPMFFDVNPGSCPNPFNPKKKGVITAAVPGTGAFDVHSIDLSTLELWVEGEWILPLHVSYADVTAPVISEGECDCHEGGPDGTIDMVLKFSAQEVAQALGSVRPGDVRVFQLLGNMVEGDALSMSDCVTIVGNPESGRPNQRETLDVNR